MRQRTLAFLGVIAFLGSVPTNTRRSSILKSLSRIIVFSGLPIVFTIMVGHLTGAAIDELEAKKKIWVMADRPLTAASEELGHIIHLTKWSSDDSSSIAIGVGIDSELPAPTENPCQTNTTTERTEEEAGYMCLFHISRLATHLHLPEWLGGKVRLPEGILPFKEVEVPVTSYAIADVVIERAIINGVDLNNRKASKIRFLVEKELGNLFLPDSEEIVWARRLNGPIQFVTYLAFFYALLLLLMRYLEFVLPNSIIRSIREVTLTDEELQKAKGVLLDSALLHDGSANQEEGEGNDGSEAEAVNAEAITRPTPWWDSVYFRNYHETNNFYIALSDHIRGLTNFLGCRIDAPVLRFRRAAAHAVENTRDTSIVPLFLDAQRQSLVSFSDARANQIRFLIWAIPTIGFIGTVIGISEALTSTVPLQSTRDFVAAAAQGRVSALMGMAFDTTLIALLGSFVIMLLYHLLQENEESMVIRERDEAEEEVMRNVRVFDDEAQKPEVLVGAIASMEDSIPALAQAVTGLRPALKGVFEIVRRMQALQIASMQRRAPHAEVKGSRGPTYRIWVWLAIVVVVLAGAYWGYNSGVGEFLAHVIEKVRGNKL